VFVPSVHNAFALTVMPYAISKFSTCSVGLLSAVWVIMGNCSLWAELVAADCCEQETSPLAKANINKRFRGKLEVFLNDEFIFLHELMN
jgi:hypothetical protein